MSEVSIVVPCRDAAPYLAQTIRSALNQTAPPMEIVVVDDGSTDGSAAIAHRFEPPVRVLPGRAAGASAARRLGAGVSSGSRLMFLDADDLLTPGTLAALDRALDGGPAAALALCPWDRFERHGAAWVIAPPSAPPLRPGENVLRAWMRGAWSPPCAVLWTREGYEASGGWPEIRSPEDDGQMMRRALACGLPARITDEGLALYRRVPGEGASLSGSRRTVAGLRARLAGLIDTRDALAGAGRLPAYRAELAAMFLDLARAAADVPEVAGEAREAAAVLGSRRARPKWDARARLASRMAEWRRPQGRAGPRAALPADAAARIGLGGAGGGGPLVSVVIPTFDRREEVVRAVHSVLAQGYRGTEILVIDDGSTDGTAAALGALGDDRVRVVRQENGGVARARNRGLAEAKGDLIAFLDSDDLWLPGKLERQVALLGALPARFGICVTGAEDRRGGETVATRAPPPAGDLSVPLLIENLLHAPMATVLVRREVVDVVGGFDPDLPAAEDWEWLQRVTRLYHVATVDAPLAAYLSDEDGLQRSRQFRANMAARAMLWRRNAHALRRHGLAHLFLMESARRELREREGDPAAGRALVLRALSERPQHRPHWPWVAYMAAPSAVREWLRRIDAPAHERRARAGRVT